jgi:hypothetical protein
MANRGRLPWSLLVICLGLAAGGMALPGCRRPAEDGEEETMALQLTVTGDKERYDLDEPIRLTVSLANNGPEALTINGRFLVNYPTAPEPMRDLYFEISGPDGYSNKRIFRVNAGYPGPNDLLELRPGATHQKVVELTRYHSLHLPGEYQVTAHYLSAAAVSGRTVWLGQLTSEPLTLERGG